MEGHVNGHCKPKRKTIRTFCLAPRAAPSEAAPRGKSGDQPFNDCDRTCTISDDRDDQPGPAPNVQRVKRPFLFGVQEPFLFSGKYRKEKWVLNTRSFVTANRSKRTDCHGAARLAMTCRRWVPPVGGGIPTPRKKAPFYSRFMDPPYLPASLLHIPPPPGI